jgi:hypothetical protein
VTYREAKSLAVLLAEVNKAAPNRSTVSDGWIGDAAHASRDSDHNPWVIDSDGVGVVRARDFTHDPAGGLDCNDLADDLVGLLRANAHPALGSGAYIIWNKRIISHDRLSEGWRDYTGTNDHTHHLHLSVALNQSGYDSEKPWRVLVVETPRWDQIWELADAIAKSSPAGSQRREDAVGVRKVAAVYSTGH